MPLTGYIDDPALRDEILDQMGHVFLSTTNLIRDNLTGYFTMRDGVKAVLGMDLPTFIQQIGDCLAVSGRDALFETILNEIYTGELQDPTDPSIPYLYSIARTLIGNMRGSYDDGAAGVWLAAAVAKFGFIPGEMGPRYSAQTMKDWGAKSPPKDLLQIGAQHPVVATKVTSFRHAVSLIAQRKGIQLCTMIGVNPKCKADGFNTLSKTWGGVLDRPGGHAISVEEICVGKPGVPDFVLIQNQWDNSIFSPLVSLVDGSQLPRGRFRVTPDDFEEMRQSLDDTHAFGGVTGFNERGFDVLKREDFEIV